MRAEGLSRVVFKKAVMLWVLRNAPITPSLGERRHVPLFSVQSLYTCKAEVITMHTPSTSDACDTPCTAAESQLPVWSFGSAGFTEF
jgi:hypothetical protein